MVAELIVNNFSLTFPSASISPYFSSRRSMVFSVGASLLPNMQSKKYQNFLRTFKILVASYFLGLILCFFLLGSPTTILTNRLCRCGTVFPCHSCAGSSRHTCERIQSIQQTHQDSSPFHFFEELR